MREHGATSGLDERGLPAGYPYRDGWEVTPRQVKAWQDDGQPLVLIDCRTEEEYAVARIEGAVFVPMHEMIKRLDELRQYDKSKVVVHCHHGMRSLQVAAFLRQQGFLDVTSMAGGIDVWSVDVDTAVPRY